jgi:recombination protein RecT
MSNLPTVRVGDRELTVTQMLTARAGQVDKIMPEASGMTGEQLCRIAHMEVIRNEDLAKCNPLTIMNAVYDAARLGLLIGHEAHLVPFKKRCTMVPDYRGYLKLAYNSGIVSLIDAKAVFPEDHFVVTEGTQMRINHQPDYDINRELGDNIKYVYAIAHIHGSPHPVFHVMNRAAVDKIRDASAMSNGIPWQKWYDRQALKSVIKYLCDKRLPATRIHGLRDLIELDNRAEVGRATSPTSWEDKEDVERQIQEETEVRSEDLRMALNEAQQRQREPGDESEHNGT